MRWLKFILLSVLAVSLCGCEYYFPLEGLDDGSKLYVQCIAGNSERTYINVQKAMGVNTTGGDILPDVESISLKVNGRECSIERLVLPDLPNNGYYDPELGEIYEEPHGYDPDYYTLRRYNLWYTDTPIKDGDDLSLEVKARGLEDASAHTTVPQKVVIQNVEAAPRCTTITDFDVSYTRTYMSFDITLADASPDDFYGVRVMLHSDVMYSYDNGSTESYTHDGSGSMINWSGDSGMMGDIQEYQGPWTPAYYNNYFIDSYRGSGIQLISGSNLKNGHLEFDCTVEFSSESTSETYDYNQETGELEPSGNVAISINSQYKIVVYRVSPEFFRYNKAQYLLDSNYLAQVGLSPSTFSYTNVNGGFGVLGALTATSTPWYPAPAEPE